MITFETVKKQIEAEQGYPLSDEDERICRAAYYFALGVELQNSLSWWNRLKNWLLRDKRNPRPRVENGKLLTNHNLRTR